MRQLLQRAGVLLASMLFLVSGSLFMASPAQAATCYGDYCSNKDPQATGCSVGAWTQTAVDVYAKTDFGAPNYAGRLELRTSTTCGSIQWARFTPVYGGFNYDIGAEQPETGYVTDTQHGNEWQSAWSNQIYSPQKCVRARIITHTWISHMYFYTPCL